MGNGLRRHIRRGGFRTVCADTAVMRDNDCERGYCF